MSKNHKNALVVDDDALARTIVVAMLEGKGWSVSEGEDGDDAVRLAKRQMPDLIILDLLMPGKDGFEAYKELKEEAATSHIPIVVLTAVNDFELGESHDTDSIASKLGVDPPEAFLEKPVDLKTFIATVEAVASR